MASKSILLRITSRHSLRVVVFGSLAEMRAEFSRRGGVGGRTALAAFVAPRVRITPRGRITNKVIGHILLVDGKFGAGIFAHELQHFVSWWCSVKKFDLTGRHWEYLPRIVGDLTNRFWNWYYEELK
jgi:hypothetical protein